MYPVFWTLSIVMLIFSFNGLICISPRRYYNTYFTVKLYTMSLHTCIPCYYIVQTRCPCRRMLRFRTIFRRIRNIVPQRAPDRRPYIHDGKCCDFAGKQWKFVMFYRAGGETPPLRYPQKVVRETAIYRTVYMKSSVVKADECCYNDRTMSRYVFVKQLTY